MKNILLIMLCCLFLAACATMNANYAPTKLKANDPLGIGLLSIKLITQDVPLYAAVESSTPFDTIHIDTIHIRQMFDPSKWIFRFKESNTKYPLQPYRMFEGAGALPTGDLTNVKIANIPIELTFRVLKKSGNIYCVITNEMLKHTAVIKAKNYTDTIASSFESWEEYFKKCESIARYNNPIYVFDRPNGRITDTIAVKTYASTIKISGYWLGLTYSNKYGKKASGWIKWRTNDKLLTDFAWFSKRGLLY